MEPMIDGGRDQECTGARGRKKADEVADAPDGVERLKPSAEGYRQEEAEQKLHSGKRRSELVQKLDPLAFELADIGLGHAAILFLHARQRAPSLVPKRLHSNGFEVQRTTKRAQFPGLLQLRSAVFQAARIMPTHYSRADSQTRRVCA